MNLRDGLVVSVLIASLLVGLFSAIVSSMTLKNMNTEISNISLKIDGTNASIKSMQDAAKIRGLVYALNDIKRDKIVGIIHIDHSLKQGDRVFLGEDMYDINYVKVFPTKSDQQFDGKDVWSGGSIELLVSFAGKATDAKPK